MDLFEYAWLTSFQITKKNHEEVRILVRDDVTFPALAQENRGYSIYLARPKRRNNGQMDYLGLLFDLNNDAHKKFLWQIFKASVFHLSMHVASSDFHEYAQWSKGKNVNLAAFTASVIEDASVRAALKTQWTPFISDVALANAVSFLNTKPAHIIADPALRLMTSVTSYFTMGTVKGHISDKTISDVHAIVAVLNKIENTLQNESLEVPKVKQTNDVSQHTASLLLEEKIESADAIYRILQGHGVTTEVPSLLYTENHGCSSIFTGRNVPGLDTVESHMEIAQDLLRPANHETQNLSSEKSADAEASEVFLALEAKEAAQEKIRQNCKLLGSNTRFHSFEFPNEDFSEYLHVKSLLSSPIRRILEKLRLYRNQTGEDYRHEVGLLDMQEAIQVIASRSQRTDVFVRDELQSREDTWTILIDASHSLESFVGEVKGMTLCLGEVARELFTSQNNWSQFAFNDRFYIIKDFTENYTNHVRARIGGLEHGGMTYISDALSLAAEMLKRRTEEIKLLVMVSDFFPSDYDPYAEDRLVQCVKKIEKSGIGVIGIGVKSRAARKYFRINCVVDDPYELMKKFVTAFFEFSSAT